MSDECRKEFEELKPCPFCGHRKAKKVIIGNLTAVRCEGCEAEGPPDYSPSKSILAWNRRASAVVSREAIANCLANLADEELDDCLPENGSKIVDAIYALQLPAPKPVSTAEPVAWAFDTFPSGRGLAFENPYRNDSEEMNRRQNVVPLFSRPPVPSPVVSVPSVDLSAVCHWNQWEEHSDTWDTSCGQAYSIIDGTPEQNGHKFCHHCGKPMVQHEFAYQEEDDDE